MKSLCNNIPTYTNSSICENISVVNKSDFVFSYLFRHKIKKEILDIFRFNKKGGVINFHPAPLPDYKGVGGCCYALLNNYKTWGVTAHYVNEEFDNGNIIDVFRFNVEPNLTAIQFEHVVQEYLFSLFKSIFERINNNIELVSVPQKSKGIYFSQNDLNREKVITLKETNEEINRKINLLWFPLYEGAYIEKDGEKFYIINKKILKDISKFY